MKIQMKNGKKPARALPAPQLMPAFRLPAITITPKRVISNVIPASTSLWVGPVLLELPDVIKTPCETGPAASGPGVRVSGLAGPISFLPDQFPDQFPGAARKPASFIRTS